MKERNPSQPLSPRSRDDEEMNDAAAEVEEFLMEEQELKRLLALWIAPDVPASLDQKVLQAFRSQSKEVFSEDSSYNTGLPEPSQLSSQEEQTMKQCQTCREEFAEKFSFCPVDGTPLYQSAQAAAATEVEPSFVLADESEAALSSVSNNAYHLTIIEDAGLSRRLFNELGAAARQSQLTLPEFKRDPVGFTRRSFTAYGTMAWRFFSGPNIAIATLAAILFMMTAVIGLVWIDRQRTQSLALADKQREDIEFQGMVEDIPDASEKPEEGAAGMNKGNGGGSKAKQEKPGGGGGGGRNEQMEASKGKLPQATLLPQVLAPDPKPPVIKNPSLPTATSIQADPLLFPPDTRPIPYGDPKSQSAELSSGTGTGNGIGSGTGGGVGSGSGTGYGPGEGFNTGGGPGKVGGGGPGGGGTGLDPNRIYKPGEVTSKARITSKPTPEYTEEARKNQVTGTVVLQMVLSSSGSVTNIRTVSGLPFGLTEKAISAARRIQFTPATKEGRAVSQYIRVEYNFNIY